MPHISKEKRKEYRQWLDLLRTLDIENKGDLEYLIYCLMGAYMTGKLVNYTNLHDTTYAAVHAAHEFERLHLDKREDVAKGENGEAFYND